MSIVSVQPKSFILALFIRDDNERFLLGDNGYDFKDSQLHFAANTIENDEVQKQGADGVMIAGQVRRASVQSFDGFVGDATMAKETIEQMRRDFIAFFLKGHHYRVIYVDCNRNAWQRKGGYLVDAPEVKELWQIHPEYHVGLNFEDVNYYSYDEDADGNEILANLVNVPVSTEIEGGLVWDEDGAVSEEAGDISYDEETADATPAKNVYITDATEAPLASFQLDGETSQNGTPTPSAPVAVSTTTGENVVKICGKNLIADSLSGTRAQQGATATWTGSELKINRPSGGYIGYGVYTNTAPVILNSGQTLTYSAKYKSGTINAGGNYSWRLGVYGVKKDGTKERFVDMYIPYNTTTPSATATATISSDYIGVAFGCYLTNQSNTTTGDVVFDCQLELGSTATTYEPYQGQSYEVNLGKNLLNPTEISSTPVSHAGVDVSLQSDGTILLNGTSTGDEWVNIMGGDFTTSTYNIINIGQTTVSSTNTDGTLSASVSNGTVARVIHDNTNGHWAFFIQSGASYNNAVLKIQFEKGSTATDFAPYFTPIELCKIGDYQDYIYKSGGKWYVRKAVGKVIYNGTEDWQIYNGFMFLYEPSFILSYGDNGYMPTNYLADNFTRNNLNNALGDRDASYLVQNVWGERDKQRGVAMLTNSTFTDLSAWKTWLGSHNTTIYYQLDSPTDEEITNAALITQLDNVASAPLYTGVNNITTITPNEQGTLEISYYTKYQPMVGSGGYVWEAGGAGGPTVIINNSIDNVSPVWTIYGPTTNPQLENATTGETIEYVGTIAQGQTLTIDMGEQTASLDGLNVISNLVGDFIQLAPGRNNMIYSVSGEAGASELGWSEIVG